MEQFDERYPKDHIYDVKMAKRDKDTLRILFNILIPNIEKPNAYSCGSNSTVAPSFDALLRVTYKLCTEIGARAYQYRKYLNVVDYRTDLSWGDEDINLSEYANFIPNLDGNDGVVANNQQQGGAVVSAAVMPGYANTTPGAIGASNLHAGIATNQNPGVFTPQAPPTQEPFRGLGSTPPPTATVSNGINNTATRVAQQVPITNPSIFANPPQVTQPMGMPGMMPGMGMPGMMPGMGMPMGMPGMMSGMGMPGMMPGMGMQMPGMGMHPGTQMPGMQMPGMQMPGMQMPGMGMMPGMQMQGMQMPMQGQAPFPTQGQVMQQPMQPQMVQQPMMMQQQPMMYNNGMQQQPMMMQNGMQQPMGQQGGGLFKRA